MYDFSNVVITSSPHIKSNEDTRSIMADVVIALIPAMCVSTFVFGPRAILMMLASVVACLAFETLYNKITKKQNTIGDLSAVVTGVLLSFVVPVTLPIWMLVVGDGVAMIFAKGLFGGLGKNFINPALAGRAFLMASWPVAMTTWVLPHSGIGVLFPSITDANTGATPMAILKGTAQEELPSLLNMFLGQIGGSMGEVSSLALLIGGIYLLFRKVINIHIPAAYILTVAILTFLVPTAGLSNVNSMFYNLFGGGLMLGAIFMATDYVTSPVSKKGQVVFGIGCGLLTFMIRRWGGYPEGVCYSIMIMNCTVWLIDKYTRPTKFGAPAKQKKEG